MLSQSSSLNSDEVSAYSLLLDSPNDHQQISQTTKGKDATKKALPS